MDKDLTRRLQLQQEQLLSLQDSQGWLLIKQRLEQEYRELSKKLCAAVHGADINSALQIESAMRKLDWVIALPQQLIRECGKSGENT